MRDVKANLPYLLTTEETVCSQYRYTTRGKISKVALRDDVATQSFAAMQAEMTVLGVSWRRCVRPERLATLVPLVSHLPCSHTKRRRMLIGSYSNIPEAHS